MGPTAHGRGLAQGWVTGRGRGPARLLWALAAALLLPTARAQPATAHLPTAAFAALPKATGLTISPGGKQIAGFLNQGDRTLLFTRDIDGEALRVLLSTDNKEHHFSWVRWVSDERLVVALRFPAQRGFVDTTETRLVAMKPDGSNLINLVPPKAFAPDQPAQLQDEVVDWLPEDGQHILLQLPDVGRTDPGVFKVEVETGRRQLVHLPRRHVQRWLTDATHRVRVGVKQDGANIEIIACDPDGERWRTLWRYQVFARESVMPLGFGKDPNLLYVLADHQGHQAVYEVRIDQALAPGGRDAPAAPTLVLRMANPGHDIEGDLLVSPVSGEAIGVRDASLGDAGAQYWSAPHRALATAIDKALPERFNRIFNLSRDEQRYLLFSSGNGVPGEYYVGNKATGSVDLVAEQYPDLPSDALVGKRSFTIQTRDGLALRAYLTLPRRAPDAATSAKPSLILLPHGGPISRDDIDFDTWTEFLAARGYAVLQVDFRGSAGYGHDFMAAGLRRWGLEMQDDLTDAVQWAVGQGLVDPRRICIVGASYGGYAALMGAVKTPDLYRCAVSFAGVTDLLDLVAHQSQFLNGRQVALLQIGSDWGDRARLRETSPTRQAARIQVPVLLVHGKKDRSVPYEQSETMASALKKVGKPYRFVTLEEGDHHLSSAADRLLFFQELEGFLAQHLGVGP